MPTTKDYIIGIYTKATEQISVLRSILEALGGQPEPVEPVCIVYPAKDKKTLPTGTTVIKTKDGKATLPDGSIENLSSKISENCRSFLVDTNAKIELQLRLGGAIALTSSIYPSKIRIHDTRFDEIRITAYTDTEIQLFASNTETPTIEDIASTTNKGSLTTNEKSVATAGTAVQLPDISVPDGYRLVIKADPENTGNIYIGGNAAEAQSHYFTLQPNESVVIGTTNASNVYIDAEKDGEGVELLVEQD